VFGYGNNVAIAVPEVIRTPLVGCAYQPTWKKRAAGIFSESGGFLALTAPERPRRKDPHACSGTGSAGPS